MLSKILIVIDKSPQRPAKMHLFICKVVFSISVNRTSPTPSFIPPKSVSLKNFYMFPTATWSSS